ncbi:site-specific integrase [Bacillus spizizenii]
MDNLVFTVLAYTGLRIGELLALKWTDFNDELGSIRITKTLYNTNNHIEKNQLLTPKTKGPVRTIRIDEIFVDFLESKKFIRMKLS